MSKKSTSGLSMRSYSSEDLNNFRKKLLHENNISVDMHSLTKILRVYQNFLREELLKGKTVLISGVGEISSDVKFYNKYTGFSKEYIESGKVVGKVPRYTFKMKFNRSLRSEMNKRFIESQKKENN